MIWFSHLQTKDVTTAMGEGRFDDAVKLRGKWGMHFGVIQLKVLSLVLSFKRLCVSAAFWSQELWEQLEHLPNAGSRAPPRGKGPDPQLKSLVSQSVSPSGKYI